MWACLVAAGCLASTAALADTASGLQDFAQARFGEAFQAWRDAARGGDPDAALYLGVLYDLGEGVAADPGQALDWYGRAARLGSVPAMFNIAVVYDSGRTVARDPARALQFYRQAAEAGYPRAEFNLGLLLQSGDGVPRDPTGARKWFGLAYRHGLRAALPHLVSLGAAPPRATLSAPPGDPDRTMQAFDQAQAILLNRNPAELHRAVELFRIAAEANDALAAYDLAYCYEHAIGTAQNLSDAYRWYRRALARAGDDELRGIARRNADQVAERLPPATRATLAQAGY